MSQTRKPCTASHLSRVACGAVLAFAFVACMAPASEGGGQVAIDVSPLTLPGLGKVCYDLRVTNDIAGGGSTVWSAGNPAIDGPADTDALCSDAYGNGARGGLTFVGACDASPKNPGDPGRTNSVTLWVDALYDTGGASISPRGATAGRTPARPDARSRPSASKTPTLASSSI